MSNLPQLLILAGGMATRLEPISNKLPKSLIEINGKPFICHQLEQAKKRGIKEVILCIGNMGNLIYEKIKYGEKYGLNVKYSDEGKKLLGTGGAIFNAKNILRDPFFVLYGDSWINAEYVKMYQKFKKSNYPALISVYKNNNEWDKSNITIKDQIVTKYNKTKKFSEHNYIDYGLSLITKEIFANFRKVLKFDLGDVYNQLSKQKQLEAFEVYDRFYEIGSFQGIIDTKKNLQKYL